ncbi:hypothetical protein CDO87_03505 [Sagittula sp. P11]|uniref:hypothetical protein n=1 Tax=Sagittula sp. P11 TaxID=2009329 RepID=UPI000C2D01E0|nr:hypothetical protein [Sagittula sp. P11]AUC52310.1 hypothetical protein CDO87_03505 [Sagittula sp. P11]
MDTTTKHPDYARALAQFERAGGPASGYGLNRWLSRGLGVSDRRVKVWRVEGFPTYALRVLDLLARLDVRRWPEDWRLQ